MTEYEQQKLAAYERALDMTDPSDWHLFHDDVRGKVWSGEVSGDFEKEYKTMVDKKAELGATLGHTSYFDRKPTGRAAKSPELQQELIAAAKAKRERRARSPGRCQTRYLKGGIDYIFRVPFDPSSVGAV